MWVIGLVVSGLGTILGAVNLITTILTLRAPGMTMFRMPIFTWNMLFTSVLVILVFPLLAAALLALSADRLLDAQVFNPDTGGPMLWQHLFWFFGHPEVYIIALPFFGIITEVIPVFSRKPIFGYTGLVLATIAITVLSMAVWAHHMFATGQVLLPFFSILSYLIAVPTGVKFFNWIGTMWKGQLTFETPMLFAIGFLVTFLLGGLTGVLLASPPADWHTHDSYFVVAHFHYVVFGTVVFALFAGFYFWWPKMTGRLLDERLGKLHFWTMFIGFHGTFLVHHWLGNEGMPRRYADYLPTDGFTTLNTISSVFSFVLGASTLFFIWNAWKSWRYGAEVTVDDPWGFGNSLEWATTCPPPLRNFDRMPRIRSERPAFDAKYGELVSDLGRDLPQRTTRPPQEFRDEIHREVHRPESPSAEERAARGRPSRTSRRRSRVPGRSRCRSRRRYAGPASRRPTSRRTTRWVRSATRSPTTGGGIRVGTETLRRTDRRVRVRAAPVGAALADVSRGTRSAASCRRRGPRMAGRLGLGGTVLPGWRRVGEHRLAQPGQRPRQQPGHVHLGDAEPGRDLRLGLVAVEPHGQDPPLPPGQPVQQAADRHPVVDRLQRDVRLTDQVAELRRTLPADRRVQ
ncbi:hypothetical protein GCM10029963_15040 [Micromonospora andamanensis]